MLIEVAYKQHLSMGGGELPEFIVSWSYLVALS